MDGGLMEKLTSAKPRTGPCTKCKCIGWLDDDEDGRCDNNRNGLRIAVEPLCNHPAADHAER